VATIALILSAISLAVAALAYLHTRGEAKRGRRAELVASRGDTVDHGPLIDYDVTVENAGPWTAKGGHGSA